MEIVVHAGMHKTGTTSFQYALRQAASGRQGRKLRVLTTKDDLPLTPSGFAEGGIAGHVSAAAADGIERLVISHEAISLFPPEGMARLRAELAPHPARFVVVFRHWCSYLPSRWRQNCKRRDAVSFIGFLDSIGHQAQWFRFDKVLSAARDAGFDDVEPISFDASKSRLLDDLMSACGLSTAPRSVARNEALPLNTLEKLRLFNAARSARDGLPANAMLRRQEHGEPILHHYRQADIVTRILDRTPDLDTALDTLITRTGKPVTLLPEQFAEVSERVEAAAGRSLFVDIEPHTGCYAALEFEELPRDLRAEMTAALSGSGGSLMAKVRHAIAGRLVRP